MKDIRTGLIESLINSLLKINNTKTPFILKMQVKRINGILPVTSCNYWNEEIMNWEEL
jgi:hypothetical protein